MNKYISLNREESSAIKGLLIFLIVLGHNALFTSSLSGSFEYLYSFHVQAFFVLPFLYGISNKSSFRDSFKKNFVRLYYPFLLFFIALSILAYITDGSSIDMNKVIEINDNKALYFADVILTGNFYLIDYFTSFQYLWFLPVMFSMSVIKETIGRNKLINVLVLVVGFVSYIIFFVFMYNKPYDGDINFTIMLFSPFAVLQGCGAYFLGRLSLIVIDNRFNKIITRTCAFMFLCLSTAYIVINYQGFINKESIWALRLLMPILFIGTLYTFRKYLANSKLLKKLGNNSFQIYIIHPPLCAVSYLICSKFMSVNIFYAIIVQIAVMLISYYVSVLWNRITPLRKKTLPRTIEDLYII